MNKIKFIAKSCLTVHVRALGHNSYENLDLPYFLNNHLTFCNIKNNYKAIMYACYRTMKENVEEENFDEAKSKLIKKMNFKTTADALPFYKLSTQSLHKIIQCINKDVESGFCTNRLYYISDHIKCSPSELSKYVAKRTFLYTLSSEWLENSLKVLLEMNVPGHRILRDLWVFKYHHITIRNRLQRVKDTGIVNLYPWMVRCSEEVLNRSIQITQDAKSILGEDTTTQMYMAKRLDLSPEQVEQICNKLPSLKTIRVTKLKNFLDFLIDEGFEAQDIANTARILTSSQKTVKQRLERLRELGVNHINLNILCRNRKDYKKYETLQIIKKKFLRYS